MTEDVKIKVEKTKRFVKKHQTLVACAATAIIVRKITYAATLKGAIQGSTDVVYRVGLENGAVTLQRDVLLDFINQNNYDEDVREFIRNMK
ncbi:MAG: hypothetical protein ABIW84_08505 [Ilumatobacteraceae bacterium]